MDRITIKDIARMAGVSVTTVSRALNDSPEIRQETKARILQLCRETGYHTSILARSLISGRSRTLAIIVPSISNPFHAALSLYVESFAKEQGYQVMLCSGNPGDDRIDDLFDFLLSQRVDGVLLSGSNRGVIDLLRSHDASFPIVLLGSCAPEMTDFWINTVKTNNYVGGKMAAEYFHRLGHRKAAYLGYRSGNYTHALRYKGFMDTANALGMEVETIPNPYSTSTIESGYELAYRLFSKSLRHTAVFAVSDIMALGVLKAADERGIALPEDLSLMGYDNIDYAALPNIRLTTIAQPIPQLARASVKLLLELIEFEDRLECTHKLLLPSLIERRTCRSII